MYKFDMKRQDTASSDRIKRPGLVALTKQERMLLYKYKGTLLPQSALSVKKIVDRLVPAKRSTRFYAKDVQQNYCTYKKLKSLFPNMRHLLPAAACGKGKEGLTAKSNTRKSSDALHF